MPQLKTQKTAQIAGAQIYYNFVSKIPVACHLWSLKICFDARNYDIRTILHNNVFKNVIFFLKDFKVIWPRSNNTFWAHQIFSTKQNFNEKKNDDKVCIQHKQQQQQQLQQWQHLLKKINVKNRVLIFQTLTWKGLALLRNVISKLTEVFFLFEIRIHKTFEKKNVIVLCFV